MEVGAFRRNEKICMILMIMIQMTIVLAKPPKIMFQNRLSRLVLCLVQIVG